jgi:outer membrane protein TolC
VANISDRKLANGSGSRLDLLLARTELNALRSEQLTTQALLDRAKVLLCNFIALEPTTAYAVEDTVVITYDPTLEELKRNSGQQNSLLLRYDREQRIAELGLREARAARSPVIDLTGAYQFSRATNNASFIVLNRNLGATFGVTATVPIFNGFQIDTDIKNAKLDLASAQVRYDQIAYQVNAVVVAGYELFQAAKGVMRLEEENIIAAREVLSIARERFRVGSSTIIELKDAQATYGQAVRRLAAARNAAKLAETELRRLAGVLVR